MKVETIPTLNQALEYPIVEEFVSNFAYWNKIALSVMNSISYPYISLQVALARAMNGRSGETILDYGSGTGSIVALMLKNNFLMLKKIIAVDLDLKVLNEVPSTLRKVGFKGDLELVNSSSMVPLPIPDYSVDSIVSGLAAIAYSGFYLSSRGVKIGEFALKECLKDCHRVLKPNGFLGFSSLIPNPDFKAIKRQSILSLLKRCRFKELLIALKNANRIEKASQFMKECAENRKAHYLNESQWQAVLQDCGFEVTDFKRGAYAGQGLVVIAHR